MKHYIIIFNIKTSNVRNVCVHWLMQWAVNGGGRSLKIIKIAKMLESVHLFNVGLLPTRSNTFSH